MMTANKSGPTLTLKKSPKIIFSFLMVFQRTLTTNIFTENIHSDLVAKNCKIFNKSTQAIHDLVVQNIITAAKH